MMKRLFPAPLLSAALIVAWLVLNASLDASDVLLHSPSSSICLSSIHWSQSLPSNFPGLT